MACRMWMCACVCMCMYVWMYVLTCTCLCAYVVCMHVCMSCHVMSCACACVVCHVDTLSLIALRLLWSLVFVIACLTLLTLIRQWRVMHAARHVEQHHTRVASTTSPITHHTHVCDSVRTFIHDIRTHPPLIINISSIIIQTCFITLILCKYVSPSQQRIGYEMLPTLLFVVALQCYAVCK